MTISSLGPRPAALTSSQPSRRPVAPAVAPAQASPVDATAYPAYPTYPGYPSYPSYPGHPSYPSYPPAQPDGGLWHGLGLIAKGLGEVGGAAARGLWTATKAIAGAGVAVVGFAASALFAVAKGAWHVLATVGRALGRGGRAIFDPSYDTYRPPTSGYPTYPGYPSYPTYPPAPQPDTPWRF